MKKRFPLQMYRHGSLTITVCANSDDLKVYSNKKNLGYEDLIILNGLFHNDGPEFYIAIHQTTTEGDVGHEVLHFLNTVYMMIGQLPDLKNDELYNHLFSYFCDECIKLQKQCEKE
jgi:hypothetical protein